MNRRIILKTALICVGVFLILSSFGIFIFSSKYELDTETKYRVLVAADNIQIGDVITKDRVTFKEIKESGYNPHLVMETGSAIGTKALSTILAGDYISDYDLLPKEKWYSDDDRIIILPMDVEGRLANLIKKGSLIDIRVEYENSATPLQTVLSRVFVEDILDENGLSLGENIGSRKAYAKVVLNGMQRDRIYMASRNGKLVYELYCDDTQKPTRADFTFPITRSNEPLGIKSGTPKTPDNTTGKEVRP